ncbi:hypothetical protein [Allonocardiopsis opalescens]|nr:hypothetical protein [Allonocardiopsis opalescens]
MEMRLVDGPLDGGTLDVSALSAEEIAGGFALPSPHGLYLGGRSIYDPDPAEPGVLRWQGDVA